MTSEYIDGIIDSEFQRLKVCRDPFLRVGYTGLCLFLFNRYERTGLQKYYDQAFEALEHSCASIRSRDRINLWDGLSGIGQTVLYLCKRQYVSGDIHSMLKSIDDAIYRIVIHELEYNDDFKMQGHEEALTDVTQYLAERLKTGELPDTEREILTLFANKILNKLYLTHDASFYQEPIAYNGSSYLLARFVQVLAALYPLERVRGRVVHIWEEMRQTALAQFPYLDSNKVTLLLAYQKLAKTMPGDPDVTRMIAKLRQSISITRIVENEMPTKCMWVCTGLAGVVEALFEAKCQLSPEETDLLLRKMDAPRYLQMNYKQLIEEEFVGLNGILGFITAYTTLEDELRKI